MIEIKERKHGIDFYKVWFVSKPLENKGIITYRQFKAETKNAKVFETLITDLTEEPEDIKGHFTKNCKYEVNRAGREDICVNTMSGSELGEADIDEFLTFFVDFWKSKDMNLNDPEGLRRELISYRENESLAFSIAFIGNKPSVYHTYIYDNERTRLWHSASLYRNMEDEGDNRKIVGIANRYLHYADMLYFKEKGLKIYDWGGAGRGEDVLNITKFKESFGGTPETNYEYEEVRGIKAHIFKFVVNALDDVMIKL